MINATYRRKSLLGLMVSEAESMTIIARSVAAGRHSTGGAAKSLHLETQPEDRERQKERHCEWKELLKPQSPSQ